ncbi:MAG: hypothetical protein RH942_01795 [Kiloniellaceae bacterium]
MRSLFVLAAAILGLAGWPGSATAQQEPLHGTWSAVDPATGQREQLIVTAEHLQFGPDEPPLPYTSTRNGDLFTLNIGDGGMPPLLINLLGGDKAVMTLPGTPPIELIRVAAAPAAPAEQSTAAQGDPAEANQAQSGQVSMMDEITAAMVPFGVSTRFEPLKQSLEDLLSAGWKLDQAGGAGGGFTLLLSNGDTRALCMLIPKNLGQSDTALSDCRRLN